MSNASMTPLLDFFGEMERKRRNLVTRSLLYVEPSPETLLGHDSRIFQNTVINPRFPVPVLGLTIPEYLGQRLERRLRELGFSIIPYFSLLSTSGINSVLAAKDILSTTHIYSGVFVIPASIALYIYSMNLSEGREEAEKELWEILAEKLLETVLDRFLWDVRGKRGGGMVPYIFIIYFSECSLDYDPFSHTSNDLPTLRWNVQYTLLHPFLTEQFPLVFDSPYH